MLQRLFTLAIVIICILWLVVSYLPAVKMMLPTFSLVGSGAWLAWFGATALIVFIAIQLWLVYATVTTVRAHQTQRNGSLFRLRIGAELLWTALPIVMTVALAWVSYGLWLNFTKP